MDPEELARTQGIARIAFGVGFFVAPGLTGRMWVGEDARSAGPKILTRAVGARDIVTGLGILGRLGDSRSPRGWLLAAGVADVLDVVAAALAGGTLPRMQRRLVYLLGGASAVQCLVAAQGVDDGGSP